jgi:hypothetical protein
MDAKNVAMPPPGLFSDEVYTSTDLNRRSAAVLDRAREHPVTIARNDERFALIRRDQAANMIKAIGEFRAVVDVMQGALFVKTGQEPPASVAWIKFLDEEDRLSMLRDVLGECQRASENQDWNSVADVIHEWRESADVMHSGILERTFREERDEQELSNPEEYPVDDTTTPGSRGH